MLDFRDTCMSQALCGLRKQKQSSAHHVVHLILDIFDIHGGMPVVCQSLPNVFEKVVDLERAYAATSSDIQ